MVYSMQAPEDGNRVIEPVCGVSEQINDEKPDYKTQCEREGCPIEHTMSSGLGGDRESDSATAIHKNKDRAGGGIQCSVCDPPAYRGCRQMPERPESLCQGPCHHRAYENIGHQKSVADPRE